MTDRELLIALTRAVDIFGNVDPDAGIDRAVWMREVQPALDAAREHLLALPAAPPEPAWIAPASGCRHCRDTGLILSWDSLGDEVGRACPDCERGAEVFMLGRPPATGETP